jgi:hypothetical protein
MIFVLGGLFDLLFLRPELPSGQIMGRWILMAEGSKFFAIFRRISVKCTKTRNGMVLSLKNRLVSGVFLIIMRKRLRGTNPSQLTKRG